MEREATSIPWFGDSSETARAHESLFAPRLRQGRVGIDVAIVSASSPHCWRSTAIVQRPEWNTFRTTQELCVAGQCHCDHEGEYQRERQAQLGLLGESSRRLVPAWRYAYFLAWHRGFLYYFEQQLRAVSGNKSLVLPYWDYYTTPQIPAEFLNPSPLNPLYVPRLNTSVIHALTLAPFAASVTRMQRIDKNDQATSFERSVRNYAAQPGAQPHRQCDGRDDFAGRPDLLAGIPRERRPALVGMAARQAADARRRPSQTATRNGNHPYASRTDDAAQLDLRHPQPH